MIKRLSLIVIFSILPVSYLASPSFAQTDGTPSAAPGMPGVTTPVGDAVSLPTNEKKPKFDSNDPNFRDIAKEFRCPTCTGLSVLESDAGFSVQIKEQVQEQLNLGKNHDQIVDFFVERYGPWILREPPVKGFNALAWIVPIALLVLGPILIWLLVWKRRVKADSHGVRSTVVILEEMALNLKRLKRENG